LFENDQKDEVIEIFNRDIEDLSDNLKEHE
jgi:hypothetical protein